MSISAPTIGPPARSWTRSRANRVGPGVSERTIEPPLATRGECMRQNGPSSDWDVSVLPLSPLFRRQTSDETPSEPAISTVSLWVSLVSLPISFRIAVALWNSASVSRTSRTKPCRWRTSETMISRRRGSAVRCMTSTTASVSCS